MKVRVPARAIFAIVFVVLCSNFATAQSNFQRLPGVAIDIGIGGARQEAIWVVGSDRKAYRWTGSSWQLVGGENFERIAVDSNGNPWTVATNTAMFRLVNNAWQQVPGQAKDIGAGVDGTVVHVGLSNTMYRWNGSGWSDSFGADALHVAIDPQGNPWTIGAAGQIARYRNTTKQVVPGEGKDVAVGANGSVFVIGGDNRRVWRWDGATSWINVGDIAGITRIAADSKGNPWVMNRTEIYRSTTNTSTAVNPPPPPPPPPTNTSTNIPTSADARDTFRNLVLGFPNWASFSPERPDQNRATGAATRLAPQRLNTTTYDCTTTPYTITETPDKIVTFNPDANVLWPGALLQGKGYKLGIGSLKELPIRQRSPLGISINLQTANNSAVVQNPSNVTVASAIGGIIDTAQRNGVQPATSISYLKTEAYSSEQIALSLGLSASYLASSVKATFDFKREASERTITAIFRETAFTVSVEAPQTPSSFLSTALSNADLQAQIQQGNLGADNIPVYVSSITYGRALMFSLTSTASSQEIAATLDAMYQGGAITAEGNLSAAQKRVLSNSKINIVTIGGDAENARRLVASGRLSEYFSRTNSLATYRPISYEVRNLGDGSIAKISETTNYNITECSVLTAKKVGERWVSVIDGIYFNEPGDDSDGNIYGFVFLPDAKGTIFNTPRPSAITFKQGAILGANRLITVPGVGAVQGDGRFDENNNFLVKDYFNATSAGIELFVGLLDADYTLGNADDAIVVRAESNPIRLANPFGGANMSSAPRISGVGSGSPGSATILYRQKKLCNLLEDPVSKQIIAEEPCISAATAIAQP
jgi:hypothetical protein